MKKLAFIGIIALATTPSAHAFVNASSAILRVYKAYLSEKEDCSNPIKFVDNGAAQEFDMVNSPTIGEGSVPSKKYKCLIIEMSDHVTFKPSSTTGSCTAGTSYDLYVCHGQNTTNPVTGAVTACTGASSASGEDTVWVYISPWSLNSTGSGANAFQPPTAANDSTHGVNIATDIDVTSGTGAFIFDLTNKVDGSGGSCDMQPPKFGFRAGS